MEHCVCSLSIVQTHACYDDPALSHACNLVGKHLCATSCLASNMLANSMTPFCTRCAFWKSYQERPRVGNTNILESCLQKRTHDKQLRARLHGFLYESHRNWRERYGRPSQHPLRNLKVLMKSKPVQAHVALTRSPFALGAPVNLLSALDPCTACLQMTARPRDSSETTTQIILQCTANSAATSRRQPQSSGNRNCTGLRVLKTTRGSNTLSSFQLNPIIPSWSVNAQPFRFGAFHI